MGLYQNVNNVHDTKPLRISSVIKGISSLVFLQRDFKDVGMIRSRSWCRSIKRSGIETRLRSQSRESIVVSRLISFSLVSCRRDVSKMPDGKPPSFSILRQKPRFTMAKYLPIFGWLPHYTRLKAVSDLIAGITLGMTMIPQSMAYAVLAERIPQVSQSFFLLPLRL